jgi:8-oxo-dGTP pyrophosphatase MutT (NUDIX family)
MAKLQAVRAFSAGGVVFRYAPLQDAIPIEQSSSSHQQERAETPGETAITIPQVVLVGRAADDFWVLPKGTPEQGETNEQVALREVAEETGIKTRIVGKLGSIYYAFSRQGTRYDKRVLYYLMEAIGGDVSLHDHEYDDAQWFTLDDATEHLVYTNEVDILKRAAPRILARQQQRTQTRRDHTRQARRAKNRQGTRRSTSKPSTRGQ